MTIAKTEAPDAPLRKITPTQIRKLAREIESGAIDPAFYTLARPKKEGGVEMCTLGILLHRAGVTIDGLIGMTDPCRRTTVLIGAPWRKQNAVREAIVNVMISNDRTVGGSEYRKEQIANSLRGLAEIIKSKSKTERKMACSRM